MTDPVPLQYDDEGKMARRPSDFLDLIVSNKHLEDKVASIDTRLEAFLSEQRENRITRRDVIGWAMAGVLSAGGMFGGLFYLIGTQTSPLQLQQSNFERTVMDRFQLQSEILKTLRDQSNEAQKERGDIRLDNARQSEDIKRLDDALAHRQR